MIAIRFEKAFAEQVLDAIKNGKPLPMPPGKWSALNMLSLVGILYAAVFSHGPQLQRAAGNKTVEDLLAKLPPERIEALQETMHHDIKGATEFLSGLTFHVMEGDFDESFEPVVQAVVCGEEKKIQPTKGFKGEKPKGK